MGVIAGFSRETYWSSSEHNNAFNFEYGQADYYNKMFVLQVRAVRAF